MLSDVPDLLRDPTMLCASWAAMLVLLALIAGAIFKGSRSRTAQRSRMRSDVHRERLRLQGT